MGSITRNTTGYIATNTCNNKEIAPVDNLLAGTSKALLPTTCAACKKMGPTICAKCLSSIKRNCLIDFPICISCENLSINGRTHVACRQRTPIYSYFVPFSYSFKIKEVMARKATRPDAIKTLLEFSFSKTLISQLPAISLIVPAPSSHKPLNPRLFEPTDIISQYLSKELKAPVCKFFHKTFLAKPQKSLSVSKRANVRITFNRSKAPDIRGRTALIVDDICTTGSTLNSMAKILLQLGALQVSAYTLSRDLRYNYA